MSLELGIAVVAVIVSVVSFEVNLRTAKAAERHGRMPVLVPQPFIEAEASKIRIRNIGNGPALNIVIATGTGELATQDVRDIRLSRRRHGRMWRGYAHLQPIAAGSERCYLWDWDKAVGLSYTDALGKPYALLTSAYGTKLFDDAAMPHPLLNELRYPQRCD
jgi:hypothetical protein